MKECLHHIVDSDVGHIVYFSPACLKAPIAPVLLIFLGVAVSLQYVIKTKSKDLLFCSTSMLSFVVIRAHRVLKLCLIQSHSSGLVGPCCCGISEMYYSSVGKEYFLTMPADQTRSSSFKPAGIKKCHSTIQPKTTSSLEFRLCKLATLFECLSTLNLLPVVT